MSKDRGSGRLPKNEGKACDAVVRCIERRTGDTRTKIRRPEKDGNGPPVDFRLKLGVREYAIEHTQIEAIPHSIESHHRYMELIKPVVDEVSGTLPSRACYMLYFPIETHLGVSQADFDRIRSDFIAWIRVNAQCLYKRNQGQLERKRRSPRHFDFIEGRPPGFRYQVRLWVDAASSASERGILRHGRFAPDDKELEALHVDRLRTSLCRKCPKLQCCKKDGARTVLVLESDDIALTNHVLVGQCLANVLPERTDVPDEIYLVETEMDPWTVCCMKLDTEYWLVEHLADPVMFHETDLIDLSEDTIGAELSSSEP